jgi:hypothetical protein
LSFLLSFFAEKASFFSSVGFGFLTIIFFLVIIFGFNFSLLLHPLSEATFE